MATSETSHQEPDRLPSFNKLPNRLQEQIKRCEGAEDVDKCWKENKKEAGKKMKEISEEAHHPLSSVIKIEGKEVPNLEIGPELVALLKKAAAEGFTFRFERRKFLRDDQPCIIYDNGVEGAGNKNGIAALDLKKWEATWATNLRFLLLTPEELREKYDGYAGKTPIE